MSRETKKNSDPAKAYSKWCQIKETTLRVTVYRLIVCTVSIQRSPGQQSSHFGTSTAIACSAKGGGDSKSALISEVFDSWGNRCGRGDSEVFDNSCSGAGAAEAFDNSSDDWDDGEFFDKSASVEEASGNWGCGDTGRFSRVYIELS